MALETGQEIALCQVPRRGGACWKRIALLEHRGNLCPMAYPDKLATLV